MQKHLLGWLSLFILFSGFFSCSESRELHTSNGRSLVDGLGRTVSIPDSAVRILSLSPSITESLYLIVSEERILARTQSDSFPVSVLNKPIIKNFPLDFEKVAAMRPDLVLTKDGMLSMEDAQRLEEMNIPVYFYKLDKLEDIVTSFRALGSMLKVVHRADVVADSLQNVMNTIKASVKSEKRPSVLALISHDPIYAFGKDSYLTSFIEAAGGENAVDKNYSNPFPTLRREYILQMNPEVLIIPDPESFFALYPELKKIDAYKAGRIYTVAEDLISRPGPRFGLCLNTLKSILHEKK